MLVIANVVAMLEPPLLTHLDIPAQTLCQPEPDLGPDRDSWPVTCTATRVDRSSNSPMLYHAYQTQSDLFEPWRAFAELGAEALAQPAFGSSRLARSFAAALEVFAVARLTHSRPHYSIGTVAVTGHEGRVAVIEEEVCKLPFGTLLRFRRQGVGPQPRVLIVAPMSG
ncbi:MAG: hypothetical protein ABWZ78_10525, partial [Burkholderiaceae bacterium]